MHDVLGDALKKISLPSDLSASPTDAAGHCVPIQFAPQSTESAVQELSASAPFNGLRLSPESIAESNPDEDHLCTVKPALADTNSTETPEENFQPLDFVLRHRRQIAAILIMVGMAAYWFDDEASRRLDKHSQFHADSHQRSPQDLADSDFAELDHGPFADPADPADSFVSAPPLMLPAEPSQHFEDASSHRDISVQQASEQTSDQPSSFGNTLYSPSATTPRSGQRTGNEHEEPGLHSVKFTGRIQPMD